jgi:glycosyltransferase involved in cell wall biosynthesis
MIIKKCQKGLILISKYGILTFVYEVFKRILLKMFFWSGFFWGNKEIYLWDMLKAQKGHIKKSYIIHSTIVSDEIINCSDIKETLSQLKENVLQLHEARKSKRVILRKDESNKLEKLLCETRYFIDTKNKLLDSAELNPSELVSVIRSSYLYMNQHYYLLYCTLLSTVSKLAECHPASVIKKVLLGLNANLVDIFGTIATYQFYSHLEVILRLRKIRIGIYDHAFHFPGGGQRYVAKMAEVLQHEYNVTYITNKDIDIEMYKGWFNIDLSKCVLKVIKIPFFENLKEYFISESMVIFEHNPFDIISEESIQHDVFINANMLSKVNPLSTLSLFICHFPDTRRGRLFYVNHYDYLVSNGEYTSSWIRKRWGLDPTHLLYPPIDMYNKQSSVLSKQNVILSVARFEIGGSKKQTEMMRAFAGLAEQYEHVKNEWKFIVAGGTFPNNPYFKSVEEFACTLPCNIELRPDVSYGELRTLYKEAAIFWHACGLNEKDPHLVEHFGMTTVEAMQNYCVPIVIDGGGQKEIVEHGLSGYRFGKFEELQSYTMKVVNDSGLRRVLAERAYERSHQFDFEVFKKQVIQMFRDIENELEGTEYSLRDKEGNIDGCG